MKRGPAVTHFLPDWTRNGAQRSLCGQMSSHHSATPSCDACQRALEQREAEDAETADALAHEFDETDLALGKDY